MQKVRVFLNQNASQGSQRDWESLVRKRLFRSELEFVNPQSREEFLAEIDRATRDKIDVIISVGGDGTFHALIQKLAQKDTSFLVLPAGTANDFARSLGVYDMRVHEAMDCIRLGQQRKIDLIDINGELMATNGGIGLVADIANQVNVLRHRFPLFKSLMTISKQDIYRIMLAIKVIFVKAQYTKLKVESKEFSGVVSTPLLLVNNQRMIAGQFPVAPQTRHDDGTFNVTFFTHKSQTDLLTAIMRVARGVPPENDPYIVSFETTNVEFEVLDGGPMPFIGDGELLATSRRFKVSIRPHALNVFTQTSPSIDYSEPESKAEVV